MLSISNDGYIRLTCLEIQAIALTHLISDLDIDTPPLATQGAQATSITGYTEWISAGKPALSLGWDWQMQADGKQVVLKRIADPQSNIMLLDESGLDLGSDATNARLGTLIDTLPWQDTALAHLRAHCGVK